MTTPEEMDAQQGWAEVPYINIQVPRREVEGLKAAWEADPCFELVDRVGFESYRDELIAFKAEKEAEWEQSRLEKDKRKRGMFQYAHYYQVTVDELNWLVEQKLAFDIVATILLPSNKYWEIENSSTVEYSIVYTIEIIGK